jgi:multiple antibiotic resistance protein
MDNFYYIFIVQFIALFFIIDAIGLVPVFLSLTACCSDEERHTINKNGVLVAFFILLFFAVLGSSVLDIFGISLAAFKIAGGLLLLLLSIGFVFSKTEIADSYKSEDNQSVLDISVFPLAVPLLSGPAAISMLIIFMKQAEGNILNK